MSTRGVVVGIVVTVLFLAGLLWFVNQPWANCPIGRC